MSRRDLSAQSPLTDPLPPYLQGNPQAAAEVALLYGKSGSYYPVPVSGRATGTQQIAAGQVNYVPVIVTKPGGFAITQVVLEVTSLLAGSTIRLGLYSDDGSTGLPKTLLADWGTVSGAAVAVVTLAAVATLPLGVSWLAVTAMGGAPTVRAVPGSHPLVPRPTTSLVVNSMCAQSATGAVVGAYPASAPAVIACQAAPALLVRAA